MGITTEVRLLQSEKREPLIDVTPFGIVIVFMPLQFLNADAPMDVTLLGIVMELRLLQYPKARVPMEVTSSGMTKSVIISPFNFN